MFIDDKEILKKIEEHNLNEYILEEIALADIVELYGEDEVLQYFRNLGFKISRTIIND